jgi:hypothetical protein
MRKMISLLLVVVALVFAEAPTSRAALLYGNFQPDFAPGLVPFMLATEFTVGSQPLTVTRLGVWSTGPYTYTDWKVGMWQVTDEVDPEALVKADIALSSEHWVSDPNSAWLFADVTEFTVGAQPLSITKLGVLQGTGLLFETEVGIWRVSDEALLGSAVVPQTGAGLVDGWLFVDITPFTLAANTTYRIGSSGGSDMGWGGTFQAGTGVASVSGSAWSTDWNFMYPSMYAGVDEDPLLSFRANAEIAPVPEPDEWTMLIAGLLVIGLIARRRHTVF